MMQEKDTISTKQYVWLLFSIITSFSTLQMPSMLVVHAGKDAWLSIILAWLVDVALAVVYAYMSKRFPGENMIQYSMSVFGKYIGRLVGALFSIFYLIAASVLIGSLCTLLHTSFFPETPVIVLFAACFVLIAFGAKKGLSVFARVTKFLAPIYLLSSILVFLLVAPKVKLGSLKPFFEQGAGPFLSGSPFILSFISICIIMGMYIPYCNKPKDGFKGKFIAVTIGSLMLALQIIFGVCLFGPEQAGDFRNVALNLAKVVSFGGIIEHGEAIFLMVAIGAGIMSAISLVWAFSLGTSQITGLSTYKPIVYPAALLAFIITMTSFSNSNDVYNFVNYVFPILALCVESGLEILLLVGALIFKRKGSMKNTQSS